MVPAPGLLLFKANPGAGESLPPACPAWQLGAGSIPAPGQNCYFCNREAIAPSLLGVQLSASDPATNSKDCIKGLVSRIINIQASAYVLGYKTKALELASDNADCTPLPKFQVGGMAFYQQHQVGGRAHKLDTL
ncbi:hypothetical protein DSO57_1014406 [Entomophthora muscae]|uniref:Uncharacterized protein n=1 Tax=Entomophthora muscae TaxID=34485 RepID=A0ACC2UET8_9FUNG|nr:hypothetical protein DSO57_1014406 [Entomophthora muscae]